VSVPSLLAGAKRTRIGIALRAQIEDGIDSGRGATVTEAKHDSVLVRAHDGSKLVQHNIMFVLGV